MAKMNKKAQAGEFLQDTIGLIAIALLLILFFILSSVLKGVPEKDIETLSTSQSIHTQEHISLQSFLQKQIEVEIKGVNQKMTIAELARLVKIDPKYEYLLKQKAVEAYGNLYDYEFSLITTKDAKVKVDYKLIQIGNTYVLVPLITDVRGQQFFIPSNETVVAHLEIKEVK